MVQKRLRLLLFIHIYNNQLKLETTMDKRNDSGADCSNDASIGNEQTQDLNRSITQGKNDNADSSDDTTTLQILIH